MVFIWKKNWKKAKKKINCNEKEKKNKQKKELNTFEKNLAEIEKKMI